MNDGTLNFKIRDDQRSVFYTTVYVGSEKQPIKLAFDTMVTLSMINSFNCLGCRQTSLGKGYEYQKSYSIRKVSDQKIKFPIEGKTAKGVLVSDDIWVDKNDDSTKVKEFPFLLISEWDESDFYQTTQGVIGLSKTYYGPDGSSSGPSFLN